MARTPSAPHGAPFWFTPHGTTWWPDPARRLHVATAPIKPGHKDGLITALARELNFPPGAVRSWDGLTDRLRDLTWLGCQDVVLIHRRIPQLPRGLLAGYFDALIRAHSDRRVGAPKLCVVFPLALWGDVTALAPPC